MIVIYFSSIATTLPDVIIPFFVRLDKKWQSKALYFFKVCAFKSSDWITHTLGPTMSGLEDLLKLLISISISIS